MKVLYLISIAITIFVLVATVSDTKPIEVHREVKTIEDTGIRDEVDILIKRAFTQEGVFVWEVE